MEAIAQFLEQVTAAPVLEREFLDLLSQLEYVGCRKIIRGVPFHTITAEVLRHISEEASHAYLLKAVAQRMGVGERSWADSSMGALGWDYFRRLDERISQDPEAAGLNYPAVSWAVERRVLAVYPLYLEVTRDDGVKSALTRILAQEKRHGREFGVVEFPLGLREKMIAIEAELWAELLEGLKRLIENGMSDVTLPQSAPTRSLPLQ